jgi:predicted alpha/beta superfamily hydrolase
MNPNVEQFDLSADGLGRYTIDVALPAGHERGGASYPVILTTDANILFDMVQTVAHGRFQEGNLLPPSILVGVGYPADEGLASWYGRRNQDFHGEWDMSDPLGKLLHMYFDMMKAADRKPDLVMTAGGYPRFMKFLRDELLPLLAQKYPIDPAARHTLIGHSSGGHFVLRALFDPSSPFRRYVSISPSLGSAPGTIQRAEAEYAAAHQDLDADVFVCCGAVEVDGDPAAAMCQFATGVTWTAGQFATRQWPSARLHWEVMNNEDHASIPLRAIAAGLRSVHRLRPGVHVEEIRRAQAARVEAMMKRE